MKFFKVVVSVFLLTGMIHTGAMAHFGMVIPSDNMVMQDEARFVNLQLSFSHPFELVGMPLKKPAQFFVFKDGKAIDLLFRLEKNKVMGQDAWQIRYPIKRPGAYLFAMEPTPYWEPAEDCFIIHYTKTVVAAFGDDDGWDSELGLKTEIIPLSRPFGLYSGNLFQGIVKVEGKPAPYAQIEVEYYNKDRSVTAPTDYMVAQTIKADGNGLFSYAAPAAGWWGFAALSVAKEKIVQKGEQKDIEIGAVIWVKFEEWNHK